MPHYPYRQIGIQLDRNFRNDINQNTKDIEADIASQKTRVDELIRSTPQPSEVVDARVDAKGKTYPVLKDRIDAEQIRIDSVEGTIDDAKTDKNGKQYTSLQDRLDVELEINEATRNEVIGARTNKAGQTFTSLKDRIDQDIAKTAVDASAAVSDLETKHNSDVKTINDNFNSKVNQDVRTTANPAFKGVRLEVSGINGADPLSGWPKGISYQRLNTETGWPATYGVVTTLHHDTTRNYQLFHEKNTRKMYLRTWHDSNNAWTDWASIGDTSARRVYNVQDHGAKGDNSVNDAPAIQKVLDAVTGTGAEVYFPAGTYMLQDTLFVRSNTHIRMHPNARLYRKGNMTVFVLWDGNQPTGWNGAHDITIEGGYIDMNNSQYPVASSAINFAHCHRIIIKDMTIINVPENHHIEINSSRNVKILNCTFDGVTVTDTRRTECVQIDGAFRETLFPWYGQYDNTTCLDILIQGCTFQNANRGIGTHSVSTNGTTYSHNFIRIIGNTFYNLSGQGVRPMMWDQVIVEDNTFFNCYMGIEAKPGDDNIWRIGYQHIYRGNTFSNIKGSAGTEQYGIWINGEVGGEMYHCVIEGNAFSVVGEDAILVQNAPYCVISNNTINSPSGRGVVLGPNSAFSQATGNIIRNAGGNAISLYGASHHCAVNNNIVRSAGQHGISLSESNYVLVNGNRIVEATGDGVVVASANNAWITDNYITMSGNSGIHVDSASSSNKVFHNYIYNNQTPLIDNGTDTTTTMSGNF